jgi:hypothetical protein
VERSGKTVLAVESVYGVGPLAGSGEFYKTDFDRVGTEVPGAAMTFGASTSRLPRPDCELGSWVGLWALDSPTGLPEAAKGNLWADSDDPMLEADRVDARVLPSLAIFRPVFRRTAPPLSASPPGA